MKIPAVIYDFFMQLSRQAPGSDELVPSALRLLDLPERPLIADMGCGAGRSSLQLAERTAGSIVCIDTAEPFLEKLEDEARSAGIADRIETRLADMLNPGIDCGTLDLIWAEGSVYLVGYEAALKRWKPLMKPDSSLVVSDCVWLTPDRPEAAAAFWGQAYPDMTTLDERIRQAADVGFETVHSFELGMHNWDNYYSEIRKELASRDDLPTEFIQGLEQELQTFEEARGTYDYGVLFLKLTS
ncbi:MAG: class I SAM-dependent methyltransferase [Parvularcula sp.]|nr:class I SAM-dependent methyltransferase [Parvularcula sp.]